VDVCSRVYADHSHHFRIHLPPEPVYLNGDPVRLEQIINNLLTNACKYTNPGGTIELTVTQDYDQAAVRVKDNGIGIASEMVPELFKMFTQAHQSLKYSAGGLGIGLSLVKALAELHGGSVSAFSEGEGRGSEFVLKLPALAAKEAMAHHEQPAKISSQKSNMASGRRILIVDDNQDAATSMSVLLKFQGYETQLAGDGEEATASDIQFKPDIILLDIGLPKRSGHEVCRAIRQSRGDDQPLIIALSGWGQEEDQRKSREAGFDAHLVKPVDFDMLNQLLDSLWTEK
jgi:CheY-like chemotaxis protein